MVFTAAACGSEAHTATLPPKPSPAAQELATQESTKVAALPVPTETIAVREAGTETATEAPVEEAATPEPAPPKTSPARYTKFVVDDAIRRYETEGLDATIAHHNDPGNVDGQWYVFILNGEGEIISHFSEHLIGQNLNGPQGIDAGGYEFGARMLAATEDGIWASYVYNNPATVNWRGAPRLGVVELKHAWVKRHDGLLFGSGWYASGDDFAEQLVTVAVHVYKRVGLAGTRAYFANPDNATTGLSHSIKHYQANENLKRTWFVIIADEDRNIVASYDRSLIGQNVVDVYGERVLSATESGGWIIGGQPRYLHAWMQVHNGVLFGSGWYRDES